VGLLEDVYPGSTHVRDHGLAEASDTEVWQFAIDHGYAIASKDADFHQRSFLLGHPPKVVWVRLGNCTTADVVDLLRARSSDLESFRLDRDAAFLMLS
jgi:predicted nuclease of predicted toxin-antitoxin system